jgi:hypothetical protein
MEILSPQWRHLPLRRSQDRTGTFSQARIWAPHQGQRERGATTDSPRGSRCTTTVRKDPKSKPKTAKMAGRTA